MPIGRMDLASAGELPIRPVPDQRSSYLQPASLRSRAISAVLSAGLTLLIILMLLTVSQLGPRPREPKPLIVTFHLQPPPPSAHARSVQHERSMRTAASTSSMSSSRRLVTSITSERRRWRSVSSVAAARKSVATGRGCNA